MPLAFTWICVLVTYLGAMEGTDLAVAGSITRLGR